MSAPTETEILRLAVMRILAAVTAPGMSSSDCAYACGWISAEARRALCEADEAAQKAAKS